MNPIFNDNFQEEDFEEDVQDETEERLIKSKVRVQKHGEVFTPKWMVTKMLNQEAIKKACNELETTFLEPAAGEGIFLAEILKKKLKMVSRNFNESLKQYENYSLFALSTLYGIELLEDNAQMCTQNLFEVFFEEYINQINKHKGKKSKKVLESAKIIISANLAQGNFLTKESSPGNPIIFSAWYPEYRKDSIKVFRTEYTLEEIARKEEKVRGTLYSRKVDPIQLSFLDYYEDSLDMIRVHRYVFTQITNVYKVITEEYHE